MNYVDLILRYLSGELSPDETKSFQEELTSNADLKKEFEDVSSAYKLIRDQLQTLDELAFRNKLQEAMDHKLPAAISSRLRIRPWWYIPLALAGTVAILLVLFLNQTGKEKILSKYYSPDQDPVLLAYSQDTRGEQEVGIHYFQGGSYEKALKMLEFRIEEEPDNRILLLYYLLSAMEEDKESEAIERSKAANLDYKQLSDQAIAWYCSLALIKSDRREEAQEMLGPLLKESGPYRSHAEKLEKLLLK
jgi:tetratricopeptide (TPR) repeat protein